MTPQKPTSDADIAWLTTKGQVYHLGDADEGT